MAFFGAETERIIRTKWKSIDQFAEELYALFNGKNDITQEGKLTLKPGPDQQDAPLQIVFPADPNGPAITITNGGTTVTIGGNPTDDGLTLGGITFNPTGDGTGEQPGGTGDAGGGGGTNPADVNFGADSPADSIPPAAPLTLYGEVQDKVSGNTYNVKLWARDPAEHPPIATLEVNFPYVSVDDTINPNTPCPVLCFMGPKVDNKFTIEKAVSFVPMFFPAV